MQKSDFALGKASVRDGFSGLHQAHGRPEIRVTYEWPSKAFLPSIAFLNVKKKKKIAVA